MVAIDIFSGKKLEEICPSTHNMDVPNVKKADYQLLDVTDEGFVSLLLPLVLASRQQPEASLQAAKGGGRGA